MNKILMVARWEYIEKITSKAFIISLVLTPIIMAAFGVLPSLLAMKEDSDSRQIGIIDESGIIMNELKSRIEDKYKLDNGKPNYILVPVEHTGDIEETKKNANALIISEKLEGCLFIGKNVMNDTVFEYRSQNAGNFKLTERLNRTLRDVIIDKKLRAEGLDASLITKLKTPIDIKPIKVSKEGKEEESGFGKVFFTAYGFMMMMFIFILTSGQMLVRSLLEEKSNRVVEVLLSSCSSSQLMAGKILGLSALGLTQLAVWALMAVAISAKFGAIPIVPMQALVLLIYFILGYIFYAAVFVAIGAPISTEQEAQQVTGYLTMVLIMPIVLAMPVMQNPNSLLATILSFIPLTTPTMMAIRIPVLMPPLWELIGTALVLLISSAGMMWAAGKIFRTTILLTGKRPSIGELIQIIKTK